MYDALTELVLPWFKQAAQRLAPNRQPADAQEEWVKAPANDDATLNLPGPNVDKTHESTLGRLLELAPKVWILCYIHCRDIAGAALLIADGLGRSSPLAWLVLCFPAWVIVYLGSGVLENVARRHTWLRLAENGLLLQPVPPGTVEQRLRASIEYRLLCGGLAHMAVGMWALGPDGALGCFLASASSLLILHQVWVLNWRLPTAPDFLCGADGAIDVDFVKQLKAVSEQQVAAACAALPRDAPSSFGALVALINADGATTDEAAWADQRNWAMRFLGVAPPISLLLGFGQGGLVGLASVGLFLGLGSTALGKVVALCFLAAIAAVCLLIPDLHPRLDANLPLGKLVKLPVRPSGSFRSGKDRTFAARLQIWNAVFFVTVVLAHLALCLR